MQQGAGTSRLATKNADAAVFWPRPCSCSTLHYAQVPAVQIQIHVQPRLPPLPDLEEASTARRHTPMAPQGAGNMQAPSSCHAAHAPILTQPLHALLTSKSAPRPPILAYSALPV